MTVLDSVLARRQPNVHGVVAFAAALVASVAAGAAVALDPRIALLPVVALVGALMLVDGRARTLFVVFGGMLIFQADEGLSLPKVAFLALASVAFVGALVYVFDNASSPVVELSRPLFVASTVFAGVLLVSLVVAHQNATPFVSSWLRDAAPYLIFVAAPIFALDAHAWFDRRRLVTLLVVAGGFGTVAFAVNWLHRRGIAALPLSRIGLATLFVPAALFAYGMSSVLQTMRARWLLVSSVVFALLLVTGTRTNLALLAAPIAIAVGSRRQFLTRSLRLGVFVPALGAITVGLVLLVVTVTDADKDKLLQRLDLVASTGTALDYSYVERVRQVEVAWEAFESNVLTGTGPGTIFTWNSPNGDPQASFLLDTSLTFPAKFGLVGLVGLGLVAAWYWSFLRRLRRGDGGPTLGYLTLVGYLGITVAASLGYSPFEDKGFALGLILVLALALADWVPSETGDEAAGRLVRD